MSSNLAVWPENTTLVRHLDVMVEDAARRFGRGSELCLRGEHTGCMNAKAWVHCSTGFFEPRSAPSAAGLVYKYSTNFAAAHTLRAAHRGIAGIRTAHLLGCLLVR